jgi:hypothetical protein
LDHYWCGFGGMQMNDDNNNSQLLITSAIEALQ